MAQGVSQLNHFKVPLVLKCSGLLGSSLKEGARAVTMESLE